MITAMGYNATKVDGDLIVHDVPIFVECARGEHAFDGKWIAAAVTNAKRNEREQYLPPLHVRHHGKDPDAKADVRAAGFFRITGTSSITFKGRRRTAIMAELIITDPQTQEELIAKRLPYRSVEIFKVSEPAIDGLALLDHEAPFLELPMLMVAEIDDQDARNNGRRPIPIDTVEPGSTGGMARVANATFQRSWSMDARKTDELVVACFSHGDHAHILLKEDEAMTNTPKHKADASKGAEFGDDKKDPKPEHQADEASDDSVGVGEGEGGEGGGLDVASIVKAIESGEISVKDMDAINAAIQAQNTEAEPEEEAPVANIPAAAAAPGAEAMRKGQPDETFAAMRGEIDALHAKDKARDAADERTTDVAEAMKRLEGRPLGADIEGQLVAFHKDYGAKAFGAYVGKMAETFGVLPEKGHDGDAFLGNADKAPAVAMQYREAGTDAIDKAARFANEWESLSKAGVRMSQEAYVRVNMAKAGVVLPEKVAS